MQCNTKEALKLFGADILNVLIFILVFGSIASLYIGISTGLFYVIRNYPSITLASLAVITLVAICYIIKNYIVNLCKRSTI